jgi:hypothetical protein
LDDAATSIYNTVFSAIDSLLITNLNSELIARNILAEKLSLFYCDVSDDEVLQQLCKNNRYGDRLVKYQAFENFYSDGFIDSVASKTQFKNLTVTDALINFGVFVSFSGDAIDIDQSTFKNIFAITGSSLLYAFSYSNSIMKNSLI